MGEYAEMMLEGEFCEGCGVYLGDACGYHNAVLNVKSR